METGLSFLRNFACNANLECTFEGMSQKGERDPLVKLI